MSALFILVLASISVAAVFLGAFIWSVRDNQFNDQKGAAIRMLFDDVTDQNNKQ
ncbi:MAG TPA: cbb3-type cytochrome oxidase assembly protein CcoS [Flavipsychrobacter sp.]|jgi:cbb3-type cytochrome oxidase maturation protein|nr:cbb3-type cytochrome oxidase assembly protein CcoS [Flavipsychrobacter sp.]